MNKKNFQLFLIGFTVGIINGLFGSGGGILVVLALTYIMGIEDYKAHATAISVILPLTIVSAFIYLKGKTVPLDIAYKVGLGGILGSIFGAKFLKKIPVPVLKKTFGSVIVFTALRLLIK